MPGGRKQWEKFGLLFNRCLCIILKVVYGKRDDKMIIDVLTDAVVDSLKLLPFLFLTYLLMEYIEYNAMGKLTKVVGKVGKAGPLLGGITGIVPQCGFSAAASGLFAGGVISIGTLLAVFLSTSDEMLPLFISHGFPVPSIVRIIVVKVIIAIISGFAVDAIIHLLKRNRVKTIHDFCEDEHCDCEDGIFKSALKHTIKIWIFIFAVTIILNFLLESVGFTHLAEAFSEKTWLAVPIICLIGLVPNCAASIVITECYLSNLINGGAMMAGLLVSCGVGVLVMFRSNHNIKENITVTMILYVIGVIWGFILEGIGVVF